MDSHVCQAWNYHDKRFNKKHMVSIAKHTFKARKKQIHMFVKQRQLN